MIGLVVGPQTLLIPPNPELEVSIGKLGDPEARHVVLVAYDELDLPPGTARLKQGGGHGGHNGLRDIFRHTTDQAFLRLRIGIGHPGHKDAVTAYVLGRPTAEQERSILAGIKDALDALPLVLAGDLPGAVIARALPGTWAVDLR